MATRVSVSGAGHVGLVTGACLARSGHEVAIFDTDKSRIDSLNNGLVPIREDGLQVLVDDQVAGGRLRFTESELDAMSGAEFHFVCVPTPDHGTGDIDLSMVRMSVEAAVRHLPAGGVIVVKSTVPTGTCRSLIAEIGRRDLDLVSNPEFLQVGLAVERALAPARIVVGAKRREAAERVAALYEGTDAPRQLVGLESAELIKQASNAYLAVRLSFVNEIAALAEMTGADFDEVFDGVGADPRIGSDFLVPGPGWGGSCLPKDARGLAHMGSSIGLRVVEAALVSNEARVKRIIDAVSRRLDGGENQLVALLGLAFKPGTDDTRESAAVAVASGLIAAGFSVTAFDPEVETTDLRGLELVADAPTAARGAKALVIATACPEFGDLQLAEIARAMDGDIVVDACQGVDVEAARAAGLEVLQVR